jgi:hypothetical protein
MIMMVIIVSVDFLLKLAGTEDTLKQDVDQGCCRLSSKYCILSGH